MLTFKKLMQERNFIIIWVFLKNHFKANSCILNLQVLIHTNYCQLLLFVLVVQIEKLFLFLQVVVDKQIVLCSRMYSSHCCIVKQYKVQLNAAF